MQPEPTAREPWQQAALLMQPALIRLIDQIRKQLDPSGWQGNYQTLEVWPEGTSPEIQATVAQLQQQLEVAAPEQREELTQTLNHLPQPQLVYLLNLTKQDHQARVNLWELCYQICFCNYVPVLERSEIADFQVGEVQVDSNLIDAEGEVDWHRLDNKAEQVVEQMFKTLSR
jgi:hypothetical protein